MISLPSLSNLDIKTDIVKLNHVVISAYITTNLCKLFYFRPSTRSFPHQARKGTVLSPAPWPERERSASATSGVGVVDRCPPPEPPAERKVGRGETRPEEPRFIPESAEDVLRPSLLPYIGYPSTAEEN